MKKNFTDDLDLTMIADSGQCFRWEKINDDPVTYRIIAGGRVLFISMPQEGILDLSCSENVFRTFWSAYLDSETDYAGIRNTIDPEDSYLRQAAVFGRGIRILSQDPWECLISFIISQRKNIPAIRSSIEKLCRAAGKEIIPDPSEIKWLKDHDIDPSFGNELFAFPTAEEILILDKDRLDSCSVGYRAPYIIKAAEDILNGKTDLEEYCALSDDELLSRLMQLYGVGKKVASCVSLFGFHRLDFFPIDVWMERVLKEHYENVFPFDRYAPYNGVMQQYMFYYARMGANA